MKSLITAWLVGIGIVLFRSLFQRTDSAGHRVVIPPQPKEILLPIGFFGLLILVVEANPDSARAMSILGWGVDIAAVIALVSHAIPTVAGGVWPPGFIAPAYILPNGNPDYNVGGKQDKRAKGSSSPAGAIGGVLGGALGKVGGLVQGGLQAINPLNIFKIPGVPFP